jgi:hypothetical protein
LQFRNNNPVTSHENASLPQGTRLFRISGSAATTIITFRPDGTLAWSNVTVSAFYMDANLVSCSLKRSGHGFCGIHRQNPVFAARGR